MNIPKIKRVKDPDEKYKPKKQIHPHLPNVQGYGGGSLLLMISPVKTGKSTIISNMLFLMKCTDKIILMMFTFYQIQ